MVFGLWSTAAGKSKEVVVQSKEEGKLSLDPLKPSAQSQGAQPAPPEAAPASSALTEQVEVPALDKVSVSPEESSTVSVTTSDPEPRPQAQRRFSWRVLVEPRNSRDRKPALPPAREEAAKEAAARQEYVEHKILRTRSEKRARESALVVRELIVGPFAAPSAALPKSSKVAVTTASSSAPSQKVQKLKAQLLEPKQAKKVIAHLRQLPSSDVPVVVGRTSSGEEIKAVPHGPIHAVCLPYTDTEAHEKHFAQLDTVEAAVPSPKVSPRPVSRSLDLASTVSGITSVTATSLDKLRHVFKDINVVSLLSVPNWGLGQPGDQPGILAGAVPSAKAIVEGVEEITPQLMAMGYATGRAILPSHDGVYPPTDRMSILTYWWGLEIVMPEPSVQYLGNVPSVAHTVVNFLTALSVANGGVAEILPFIRYISTYIDMEFSQIQGQDEGKGVVCAATWIMPAALVPRPWDFADPPSSKQPGNPSLPAATPAGSQVPETQAGNAKPGLPGLVVTPPTPPASESLGKLAGTVSTEGTTSKAAATAVPANTNRAVVA
ncbi:hypothetical protein GSI_01902 [Ganoderma sinense ZZ0214-1]|uniref:Uncharacterized protein n=1 Tax=Ganoderma sinense ZZ0214-1 TaxID=1077348 RepID=A0A2G8SR58_9APHY|nr:hypothetical protein GSI_01902 [Ganoderma sinense ZZ0214-1]